MEGRTAIKGSKRGGIRDRKRYWEKEEASETNPRGFSKCRKRKEKRDRQRRRKELGRGGREEGGQIEGTQAGIQKTEPPQSW